MAAAAVSCTISAGHGRVAGHLIQTLRGEAVHLVGHSMGALIGIDLAARHPDRIARLALLGAAPRSRCTRRCSKQRRAQSRSRRS